MAQAFARYPYRAGMTVCLKKKHPCGSFKWTLIRIGADARLQCQTCGRQLLMSRRALEKATKSVMPAEAAPGERDQVGDR